MVVNAHQILLHVGGPPSTLDGVAWFLTRLAPPTRTGTPKSTGPAKNLFERDQAAGVASSSGLSSRSTSTTTSVSPATARTLRWPLIGVVARIHLQPAIAPAPIPRRARAPVLVFAGRGDGGEPDLNFSRQVSVHLRKFRADRFHHDGHLP